VSQAGYGPGSPSHCLKQFCESVQLSVFSLLMWAWPLIILKQWLICRRCSKNGY